jgi:hypothetical protein
MKKNLLMGALAALTIASASAENIYISGATAYRSTANAAIQSFVAGHTGSITTSNNATIGSATLLKAQFTSNSVTHYIYVRWTGSEGGIQSCASPRSGAGAVTVKFYNSNVAAGLQTNTVDINNAAVTDIAFSDTYQSTSLYATKFAGVAYTGLLGYKSNSVTPSGHGIVGVNQFEFATGSNCAAANITSMQARQLIQIGRLPLGQITGNTNAHNKMGVYLVGRNSDSGTRLSVFGEVGQGANAKPQQYKAISTNAIVLYPAEAINGLDLTIGQSGYSSGGDVAGCFTNSTFYPLNTAALQVGDANTNNAATIYTNGAFLIGYAGVGDTRDSSGNARANVKPLTYNGVACSTNAIINGNYSLWTYEHLYANPATTTLARTVMKAIGDRCLTTATSAGAAVKFTDMKCTRGGDARPVSAQF